MEPRHPEFRTRFNSTLSAVQCTVGEMTFILHQEAIKSLIKFAGNLTDQLMVQETPKAAAPSHLPVAAERSHGVSGMTAGASPNPSSNSLAVAKKASKRPVLIQFSASASLAALKIEVEVVAC